MHAQAQDSKGTCIEGGITIAWSCEDMVIYECAFQVCAAKGFARAGGRYQPKDVSTSLLPPQMASEAWLPRRRACHATSRRTSARKLASRGYLPMRHSQPRRSMV